MAVHRSLDSLRGGMLPAAHTPASIGAARMHLQALHFTALSLLANPNGRHEDENKAEGASPLPPAAHSRKTVGT